MFVGGLLWHLNFGLQKLKAESSEVSGLFYGRLEENAESSAIMEVWFTKFQKEAKALLGPLM